MGSMGLYGVIRATDCIILQEPVTDIFSLMYHSLFSVSSGDSVARETALMGVPTIYTGGRFMAVNIQLIELGVMHSSTNQVKIFNLINSFDKTTKNNIRKRVLYYSKFVWQDTTKVILDHIKSFNK